VSSPLWKYPGVLEGRIQPDYSVAQGSESAAYYGYYAHYYSYYMEHVFCLGEDMLPFQSWRLAVGNTARVEQAFTVPAATKLIRFSWHMRNPEMPASRNLVVAGPVDFMQTGLITGADGASGFILDPSLAGTLTQDDAELWCQITGATDANNNGTHRISGIPEDQGDANGERAIVENSNTLNSDMVHRMADPAVTIRLLGLRWMSRAYVDIGAGFVQQFHLSEWIDHTWYRTALAINTSKYAGPMTIRFEMELERLT